MTAWRKSSYSGSGNNCVEVGRSVGIRDSKAPATHLPVSAEAWSAFLFRLTTEPLPSRDRLREL
ncbi:DUF397 domain-containing protein [Lentzea aerocolonigenes]|uniref:DUF397 domain-containing protein n=1 Tax=Lentzea aerocolonigenes TaxID=68170 RepID=UPI0004C370F8|nr:DUF397 domain-containing protein [Lentzea aerocolonigenes]MCP2247960.1 protein of unknown function (DUF397) [Lentzea aerocolonigenes]